MYQSQVKVRFAFHEGIAVLLGVHSVAGFIWRKIPENTDTTTLMLQPLASGVHAEANHAVADAHVVLLLVQLEVGIEV